MQLLVATRKGLFTLEKHNHQWSIVDRSFLGDPIPMVHWDPRDESLYAVLGTGHFGTKIHRSDNHGSTWTEIGTPKYPQKPVEDDDVPWSLELIWSLVHGGTDQPGTLWCGTIPGGLFKSTDRGETWILNESLWYAENRKIWQGGGYDYPGIHSICVDPRDSDRITLAISLGGVHRTLDGGNTWISRSEGLRAEYVPPQLTYDADQQDPHLIVQCDSEPNTWWMQHHNGLFVSLDDCESWQELSNVGPSTFGFTVQVHPKKPETAWFIPAVQDETRIPVGGKLVVNRTRDGGKSFEPLNHGLPSSECYDLVFRHGLAVSSDGVVLAFGSTTGNLWVSEDEGDSWLSISTHLPPVSAVRFID
jgi:photosystem II stability/assembly factor-like uncharacterized protein